jgi:hypothetical protein
MAQHTVRTFSWMQGNRRPGFGMLALAPRADRAGVDAAYVTCLLPDQLGILYGYLALLAASLAVFFPLRAWGRGAERAPVAPEDDDGTGSGGESGVSRRTVAAAKAEMRRRPSSPLLFLSIAPAAPGATVPPTRALAWWRHDLRALGQVAAGLVGLYLALHLLDDMLP